MANKHASTLNVKGNARKKLDEIAQASDKLAAGFKESAIMGAKLGAAFSVAEKAGGFLFDQIKSGFVEMQKLDASQRRLERSMKAASATSKDYALSVALVNKAWERYGISQTESNASIKRLVDASGNATQALQDYKLAVNLAAAENIELAQATEYLSKARKGEVEELKNLSGIGKLQAEQLASITNEAARAATVMDILRESTSGAAEASRGMTEDMKVAEEGMKLAKIGMAGIAKGLLDVVRTMVTPGDGRNVFVALGQGMSVWNDEMDEAVKYLDLIMQGIEKLDAAEIMDAIGRGELVDRALDAKAKYGIQQGAHSGKVQRADDVIANVDLVSGKKGATGRTRDLKRKKRGRKKAMTVEDSGFEGDFNKDLTMAEKETIKRLEDFEKEKVRVAEWGAKKRQEIQDKTDKILEDKIKKKEADTLAFEESKTDAMLIGLDASVNIASQLGANESAIASIRAAIEIGEGISALAPSIVFPFGNPAGAAAHFAAAAQFGVAAAMGGGGGGGGSAKKPAMSAGVGANRDRLNAAEAQPTETNINLDFSRSIGVGPQAGKEVAELAARGVSMASNGEGRLF